MLFSFSCQIDAEPRRCAQRDGDNPALLPKLGVSEHHFVLSEREG